VPSCVGGECALDARPNAAEGIAWVLSCWAAVALAAGTFPLWRFCGRHDDGKIAGPLHQSTSLRRHLGEFSAPPRNR